MLLVRRLGLGRAYVPRPPDRIDQIAAAAKNRMRGWSKSRWSTNWRANRKRKRSRGSPASHGGKPQSARAGAPAFAPQALQAAMQREQNHCRRRMIL
jgi:hypothetical protein